MPRDEQVAVSEASAITDILDGLVTGDAINDLKERVNQAGGELGNDKLYFKILPLQPDEEGSLKARRLELVTKGDDGIATDVQSWSKNLAGLADQLVERGIIASDLDEFKSEGD